MLPSNEVELKIFNCPHRMEAGCGQRLDCNPIPGAGTNHPKFLVVGLNPGLRNEVWLKSKSLDELKKIYVQECFTPNQSYGKFLRQLEEVIPEFRVPRTVYLTDLVKCPTVGNENPSDAMLNKCHSAYWEDIVQTLNPKYIIGLGNKAAEIIGGFKRHGKNVQSARITVGDRNYWFISTPHPNYKNISDLRNISYEIKSVLESPEEYFPRKKNSSKANISVRRAEIHNQLEKLGYQKRNSIFFRGNHIVNIAVLREFGNRTRIYWKEEWENDFAVIYDYKLAYGPTCVVPIKALFETNYVKNKRKDYGKSKDWWSGTYPVNHELTRLILKYKSQWDILR